MTLRLPAAATPLRIAVALVLLALLAYAISVRKGSLPDVKFMTISGQTISAHELRGRVVLVNFWATSCAICLREMPRLVDTHNRFAARGFETIAVAMSYDPPSHVLDYAQRQQLPFHVSLDPIGSMAKSFGDVRLTPTTFLIDKRGRIVDRHVGEPDFAKLNALVERLLRQ